MGALEKAIWNSATAKIVVKRYVEDCYVLWRDLEDLADYIPWFARVIVPIGQENRVTTFNCTLSIAGVESECAIQLTEEKPGKRMAWETVEGSLLHHRGVVEFHQLRHGTGTEVALTLQHRLPGQLAVTEVENAANTALARFKEFAETDPGELIR